MHMTPIFYEDFSYFGDIVYEISKRLILEKVIDKIKHRRRRG